MHQPRPVALRCNIQPPRKPTTELALGQPWHQLRFPRKSPAPPPLTSLRLAPAGSHRPIPMSGSFCSTQSINSSSSLSQSGAAARGAGLTLTTWCSCRALHDASERPVGSWLYEARWQLLHPGEWERRAGKGGFPEAGRAENTQHSSGPNQACQHMKGAGAWTANPCTAF